MHTPAQSAKLKLPGKLIIKRGPLQHYKKSAGHYNQENNLLLVEEPLHHGLFINLGVEFSDGHSGPLITYLGDPKNDCQCSALSDFAPVAAVYHYINGFFFPLQVS